MLYSKQAQQLRLGSDWERLEGKAEGHINHNMRLLDVVQTHLLSGSSYTVVLAMTLSRHTRGSPGARGLPAAA